jgi:hypothetical protein
MRNKIILLTFFLCTTLLPGLHAQNLVIMLHDGTQTSSTLSSIQKLSFSSSDLVLTYKSGTPDQYSLADIQKLYFGLPASLPESELANQTSLTVYPNPANNTICLKNIPEGTTEISIYRIDGRLAQRVSALSANETIPIENLQSGIYFLVANSQTAKFVKL